MMNIEQKKAEIMAKAQAELMKAEREFQIRENLPIPPDFVHVYPLYGSIGSASYTAKTKAEAFEIYKLFTVSSGFICRDGLTVSIKAVDDEAAKEVSEIHAHVDVDLDSAEFEFYAQIKCGIIKVCIRLPVNLFGIWRKDNPSAKLNFKYMFIPHAKTSDMFRAINYAGFDYRGRGSAGKKVYALYDSFEVENQFSQGN